MNEATTLNGHGNGTANNEGNGGVDSAQLAGYLKATSLDDVANPLSAMDTIRKENSDTKSVTSRVTFTMEEKESLRPDDSASMQAGQDEDSYSVQGSAVAISRVTSDPDARAFDDQLQEINQTGMASQFPPRMPGVFHASHQNGAIIYTSSQEASFSKTVAEQDRRPRAVPSSAMIPPDEKLLEALTSPRDRVFVLKIEQDIIDFVKDRKYVQCHQYPFSWR